MSHHPIRASALSDLQKRGRGRTTLAVLAAAALLTGGLATASPVSAANQDPKPIKAAKAKGKDKLGAEDRTKLAKAEAKGEKTVTVMIVAEKGEVGQARKQLRALGATIRYSADKYGYFSARVPVSKVEKAAAADSVLAIDFDEVIKIPDVSVASSAAAVAATGPGATTPDDNPYMPTNETGATAFKTANPSWDGRDVTIGILDSGVDLAHPALQKTSTGETKIADWFTATDPLTEGQFVSGGDATWRGMITEVKPTAGTFTTGGRTYTSQNGTFKFNRFAEAGTNVTGGELLGDVNRDGDTGDAWGILYDPATNDIWVDSDADLNFTNNTKMRPYGEAGQVGAFGTDNPATAVVDAMPFTVDFREDQPFAEVFGPQPGFPAKLDFVDIGIVSGAHGSHVAGITAANNMFGGQMDGAAPGAKLVSARACTFGPGCTAAALTDGMAELAANRGVDIINMSIGGLPALNDGNNARAQLYNAIIADGVQLVISAGNSGSALNTIGDPSVATDVVSVGASISKESWKANYGSDVRADYGKNMLTFSSGGPREDGGFKPNITAPGSAVSTTPTWQPGGPTAEAGYSLPPGYSMFQGTSMASPQAAGAMALLISAAKAEDSKSAPDQLRQAVYSTAVYNGDVPAFLQGHGGINVPAAWDLLKKNPKPDTFTVSAPVCTEIWKILGETQGTGIYNRCAADAGGHAVGAAKTYTVTVTRTSGKKKSGAYAVSQAGNDGTFAVSPSSVTLPLGQPRQITVTAIPQAGAHSALLRLDDPKTKGLDFAVMNVVAAGTELSAPSYGWSKTGVAERNEATRYYLTVPEGTKALQLKMSGIAPTSQTRFLAFHPYGVGMESGSSLVCYSNFQGGNGCNPAKRVYANPQPGVWEILVESRRTSGLQDNPFTLDATLLGVTVDPATTTLPSVTAGEENDLSWDVTNAFGDVTASAKGGSLASAKSGRFSIAHHAVQTYTVDVPTGATKLDVKIGNPSDKAADLDLFVTGPGGAKQSADGDSEEAVTYANPAPGRYTITVDGFAVPAGTTEYDYIDVFYSGALGAISVDDPAPFDLASGASRTVTGSVQANSAVAEGRTLFGSMSIVSEDGALLGAGDVQIGAVTPAP